MYFKIIACGYAIGNVPILICCNWQLCRSTSPCIYIGLCQTGLQDGIFVSFRLTSHFALKCRANYAYYNRFMTLSIQFYNTMTYLIFTQKAMARTRYSHIFIPIKHAAYRPSVPSEKDTIITMMTSWYGNAVRITGPLCGNPPVTGGFPYKGSVIRCYHIFIDVRLKNCWTKKLLMIWYAMALMWSHYACYHCNISWHTFLDWMNRKMAAILFQTACVESTKDLHYLKTVL